MNPHTLSIAQFKSRNAHSGVFYRDELMASNRIEDLELLSSPCRLNAMTVLLCTKGTVECAINLKRYQVEADMMLVGLPDDIICIDNIENAECHLVLMSSEILKELHLDFRNRTDFYLNIRRNATLSLPHEQMTQLRPYYTLLSGCMKHPTAETPEIIRGLVHAISYTIISIANLFWESPDKDEDSLMMRHRQLFNKFMGLVKTHHNEKRGVKFYADTLCLTPNYLSGVIKKYSGKTASEWVNSFVILEAKLMLRHSDMSIQEIAYKLHFPSQSTFGKYFKQQTGMGPKDYRKSAEG